MVKHLLASMQLLSDNEFPFNLFQQLEEFPDTWLWCILHHMDCHLLFSIFFSFFILRLTWDFAMLCSWALVTLGWLFWCEALSWPDRHWSCRPWSCECSCQWCSAGAAGCGSSGCSETPWCGGTCECKSECVQPLSGLENMGAISGALAAWSLVTASMYFLLCTNTFLSRNTFTFTTKYSCKLIKLI